jgi:hypothetical protein
MFYTTEQSQMSLTGIIISVKRIMRLNTHDFSINKLSQVVTEDTLNLGENIRSELASKTLVNFNLMLNRRRF